MVIRHWEIGDAALRAMLKSGTITLGGYLKGKIYGRLDCKSGKRMARTSRVFFADEAEARRLGFRPCGNCMRPEYRAWKAAKPVRLRAEGEDRWG